MVVETLNFDSLIIEYRSQLKTYAMNFTRDEDDADDLIQDTLLKAFTYFANFKPGTNFRGWLFTIMKNTFINNYRRSTRSRALIITEENISSNNLAHSASRNNGELKFINEDISKALKTLPTNLYDPFIRYFEGYKYHEIAEEFDMPVGTVKTRIHHARLQLKKYLKVYEELKGRVS
ncbi:RNA polymerase sigma factor [Pedobacter insulae]|uniref:RNA polymerase, sigma subunit, ECF family n=1 Tax=Pedobacter insulae TaxID=414048 RepID=A0A1I2WL60_9SPHI|nr:RNA polymerase sigma factor [Pedobacter insulae]SFH02110.1 RNA polymerase, sigma subunit, ECF family [Pedobacter insulae]